MFNPRVVVRNDDRFYEWEGRLYPSVTTIIANTMPRQALHHWREREIVKAMIAAISRSKSIHEAIASARAAAAAPDSISRRAAREGTAAHLRLSRYLMGVSPAISDADKNGIVFLEKEGLVPVAVEYPFVDAEKRYAGTIDLIASNGSENVIVDWKTGSPKDEHAIQLAAYADAIERITGTAISRCCAVYLSKQGAIVQDVKRGEALEIWSLLLRLYEMRLFSLFEDKDRVYSAAGEKPTRLKIIKELQSSS